MTFQHKIAVHGKYIHSYIYDTPIHYGYKRKPKNNLIFATPYDIVNEVLNPHEQTVRAIKKSINRRSNFWRSKRTIKQLIECNVSDFEFQFNNNLFFITYTFAENVQDFEIANYEFTKYIQRLNYFLYGKSKSKLRYLTVPERQNRGAIHYHTIHFGLPYISQIYDTINSLWGAGFSWVKEVNNLPHLINYVCKYITKKPVEEKGQKSFFCSKGLLRPVIYKSESVDSQEANSYLKEAMPMFSKVYQTEYNIVDYNFYEKI